jgi:hypothetical protein
VGDEREPSTYESGERVFGPPLGTFDVEWVAREVERRTGTDVADAYRAVESAWRAARASGSVDPQALGDAVAATGASPDVSQVTAALVARYCSDYQIDPAAR